MSVTLCDCAGQAISFAAPVFAVPQYTVQYGSKQIASGRAQELAVRISRRVLQSIPTHPGGRYRGRSGSIFEDGCRSPRRTW